MGDDLTGIIVRNDDARDRLLVELGDVPGLVYTVLDSKGLEFDDVRASCLLLGI
jgi:hypothetical protein